MTPEMIQKIIENIANICKIAAEKNLSNLKMFISRNQAEANKLHFLFSLKPNSDSWGFIEEIEKLIKCSITLLKDDVFSDGSYKEIKQVTVFTEANKKSIEILLREASTVRPALPAALQSEMEEKGLHKSESNLSTIEDDEKSVESDESDNESQKSSANAAAKAAQT